MRIMKIQAIVKSKNLNGRDRNWWLRSPYYNYYNRFCCVDNSGSAYNVYASYNECLAFGFAI